MAEQNHFRTTNIFGGKKHFCTKHHYWANKFIGRKKIGQTFLAEYIWPKMFGQIYLAENVWPNIFDRKCLAEYFWSKVFGRILFCQNNFLVENWGDQIKDFFQVPKSFEGVMSEMPLQVTSPLESPENRSPTSNKSADYHSKLSRTRQAMRDQESEGSVSYFSEDSDSFFSELQVRPDDDDSRGRALSSETLSSTDLEFNGNAGRL